MDFFEDLPNMEAVNYIVNKYSDTLPSDTKAQGSSRPRRFHMRRGLSRGRNHHHRHKRRRLCRFRPIYMPPYYNTRPILTHAMQSETKPINQETEHRLRESLNLINQNMQVYTDLYRATRNVDAELILRKSISVSEHDLNILRKIYYTAVSISPELCTNYSRAITNSVALKVLFTNEAQILMDVQNLSIDPSMEGNRVALEIVMNNEINQLKRINQLSSLR